MDGATRGGQGAAGERIDPQVWKISAVVMLGPFMTNLDGTVVNVSLAALGRELHAPLTTIQWVTSGYLLALALMLPLSGWLVDRIGAKRVYLVCFTLFTLTSLLCGLAGSVGMLIAARVLQGAVGGLLAPMAQMMMARVAGPHLAKVMGYSVIPVMLGPILGPTLAGVVLQHAGWRWIFFINLPVGVLGTVLAGRLLPHDTHETTRRSFDFAGFALLSPALVGALHAFERLGSGAAGQVWPYALELGAAAVLLGFFVLHARRAREASLVDISLFKGKTFSAAASTQFLSNCAAFGGQMLLPLYLLMVARQSPSATGVLLAPMGVGMLVSAPGVANLVERFGPRRVSSTGAVVALLGTLPFVFAGAGGLPAVGLTAALFLRGLGLGCINIPSISAAYTGLPRAVIPVATTAINIVQRLGGPMATTGLSIALHAGLAGHAEAPRAAFAATFALLSGVHALCALAALRLPRESFRRGEPGPAPQPAAAEALGD